MIRYDSDNITLVDSNGNRVGPLDWQKYSRMLGFRQQQQDAVSTNNQAISDYHTKLNNFQVNIDAGRDPGTQPTKPMQIVVDDNGITTQIAFNPPLPNPVYAVITAPIGIAAVNVGPDKTDVMIQLLMQMMQILTKLGNK